MIPPTDTWMADFFFFKERLANKYMVKKRNRAAESNYATPGNVGPLFLRLTT